MVSSCAIDSGVTYCGGRDNKVYAFGKFKNLSSTCNSGYFSDYSSTDREVCYNSPTYSPVSPGPGIIIGSFSVSQEVGNYSYTHDIDKSSSHEAFVSTVRSIATLGNAVTVSLLSADVTAENNYDLQSTSSVFNYAVQFVVGRGNTYTSATDGYNTITLALQQSVKSQAFTSTLQTAAMAISSTSALM